MPGFDGTGPLGCGRARGRGLGPCRNAANASRWDPAAASPVEGASPAAQAVPDEQYAGSAAEASPADAGAGSGAAGVPAE